MNSETSKETTDEPSKSSPLTRRSFMRSGSAAGVGVGLIVTSKTALGQANRKDSDLNVALIGCGAQGTKLRDSSLPIEGVKFTAICDIYDYNRKGMAGALERFGQPVNQYVEAE